MAKHAAVVTRRNATQFQRLPRVVAALLKGRISHDMASAIAAAMTCLGSKADAGVVAETENILLTLALDEKDGTPEKVALVGRHLRNVLNPDGELSEEDKAYGNRYLIAMVDDKGGMTGRFYLPPETAAKLQHVLDTYGKPSSSKDDRTKAQRNADAVAALLDGKVSTQITVLVNAETLPDTPTGTSASPGGGSGHGGSGGHAHSHGHGNGNGGSHAHSGSGSGDAHNGGGGGANGNGWGEPDLDEQAMERLRVAMVNLGQPPPGTTNDGGSGGEPDPLPCPTCDRPANRNTPGLLMPTGHPLPAKHVRRLLYTSQLFRVVVDAKSRVVDASYSTRFVPEWMRRIIHTRYSQCGYDDCPIEAKYCDLDHVFNWADFHRTKADEIIPACGHHNRDRAKHPEKYRLEKLPDDRWHFTTVSRN